MCSQKNLVLVLAVLVVTAGFATVARADTIYVAWKGGSGVTGTIEGYDTSGNLVTSPTFITMTGKKPFAIEISPLNHDIYVQQENVGIWRYDRLTGTVVNQVLTAPTNQGWGMCFDSSGNLFDGRNNSPIDKIKADGTVISGWGTCPTTTRPAVGFEIRGNTLYGIQYYQFALLSWDATLASGGAGTVLQTFASGKAANGELTFDSAGNLYFAQYGSPYNILKLASPYTGTATAIAPPTGTTSIIGLEYYNGALYAGCLVSGVAKIEKYDLTTQSWSLFITGVGSVAPQLAWYIVPEPGTLSLLACGLVGLLCYAWRKRK